MSRDLPLADHEAWAEEPEEPRSVLDRSIALPIAAGSWIVVATALVAGTLLRFIDLHRWPLTVAEADITLTAHNLVNGADVPDNLLGMPAAVQWTGLFLFGGGSTEALARASAAFAGLLLILLVTRFGRWIGSTAAAATALLVATSPTLIAASRRVDGGILLGLLSLALVATLLMAMERDGVAWPALSGIVTGALVLSDPLGLPAALLAALAVYLIARPSRLPRREPALAGLAACLGTIVLISTVFLTRPAGFSGSIGENLSRLWDDHLSQTGERFWMPSFNLVLNEPLLIILALVAVRASRERAWARVLGIWAIEVLIFVSILGDVGLPGYTLTLVPLSLLAGLGAAHLVERIPWREFRRGPAAVYTIAVLLAAAALLALFGLITTGTVEDRGQWMMEFAMVVALGAIPLAWTLSWLGQRLAGNRAVLVLAALLMLVSAVGVRSTVLISGDRGGASGEPLAAGVLGSDIPIVVGRLERLSRDTTATQRDSQDPAGGHGLHIAVDAEIAPAFQWYFRDYPNFVVFDPTQQSPPADAQIVLLAGHRDPRAIVPDFRGQNYLFANRTPEFYRSPDWNTLVSGLISPDAWRTFAGFVLDREFVTAPERTEFQLLASTDLAARLFPTIGPYSLDERPGAGSGEGQFSRPRGIAIAPDGRTYVVDSRNLRVEIFDANGGFVAQFGGEGSGFGQFGRFPGEGGGGPGGIAIGDDGRVYVADTWNHRIQVFSPEGAFLFAWGSFFDAQDDPNASQASPSEFYGPRGIAIHGGQVFVTDTGNERVQVFTPEGVFVRMFGSTGSGDGQLLEPVGIAVADDGTVLVADSHNARIARFTPDGEWLTPWPVTEWTGQRFFEPYLALGNDGTLYASTSSLGVIAVLDENGIERQPLVAPEVRQPFGLAINLDDSQLLVTDATVNAVIRVSIAP